MLAGVEFLLSAAACGFPADRLSSTASVNLCAVTIIETPPTLPREKLPETKIKSCCRQWFRGPGQVELSFGSCGCMLEACITSPAAAWAHRSLQSDTELGCRKWPKSTISFLWQYPLYSSLWKDLKGNLFSEIDVKWSSIRTSNLANQTQ